MQRQSRFLCLHYLLAGSNDGIDEWYSPTWSNLFVTGAVDVNTLPGGSVACVLGPSARGAGGPLLSNVAGGWLHSGRTGAAVVSSQRHTPFWTGLRSYDAPGRCSVFTVQSATLHLSFVCGSTLPVFVRWPRFLCTWLVADIHCVVESLNDLFVTC